MMGVVVTKGLTFTNCNKNSLAQGVSHRLKPYHSCKTKQHKYASPVTIMHERKTKL